MAETEPRRSAEIRRMASQKVAVEMIKVGFQGEVGNEEFLKFFTYLVDFIDEDVVAAGDRATASVQRVSNRATNGTVASTDVSPDVRLNPDQQKKMLLFLDEFVNGFQIPLETFKLKLWTMQLPNNISHEDLVKELTVEQGMTLYGWVKEQLNAETAA